jgi:peptide/nickel transport system substrate-binding protein
MNARFSFGARILTGLVMSVVVFTLIMGSAQAAGKEKPAPAKKQGTKEKPVYGGVLKIISSGNIVNLGIPSEPNNPTDITYANPAVETLLNLDEEGNPIPWLATGWTIAKDGTSITFTLRKGVKFHDGTDFNAEAVKYILDLYRNGPKAELKAVSSIDIIDGYMVRLNFPQFESHILNSLTVTPGLMVSPAALKTHDKAWAMMNPVGTGPFKLARYDRDTRITYEKFPGYWQKGKPYLDGIEFLFIADPVIALMSYKSGEAQVFMRIDYKDAVGLQTTGKHTIDKVPVATYGFAPDGGNLKSPFANIRVRRAVEHAINKSEIVKELFYGIPQATNQAAAQGNLNYHPAVKGYPYDPKKAKELLAQAGYPNGFKTKIIYQTTSNEHFIISIQRYLKDVGIDAEVEAAPPARISQISNNGWENALLDWNFPSGKGQEPGQAALRNFMGPLYKSVLRPDKYKETILKAVTERDTKKRNALYREATKIITDNAVVCPVYVHSLMAAKSPQVQDTKLYDTWPVKWSPQDAWLSK